LGRFDANIFPIPRWKGLKPPAQNPHRERLLTDDEIRQIWHASNNVVRLLICTGQRFNQIASLRWIGLKTIKSTSLPE